MASRWPPNLSKAMQEQNESPGIFLEQLLHLHAIGPQSTREPDGNQHGFNQPDSPGHKTTIKTLQQLNRFEDKNLFKLVAIAANIYSNRVTPKDEQTQGLNKVLLATDRRQWS